MKKILASILLLLFLPVNGWSGELSGQKAQKYIGNLKDWLTANPSGLIFLKRRDRDLRTFAELDGMVFSRSTDKYHYIRRLDDDHRLRLSPVRGEQTTAANPGESAKYEALIKENKLYPHVILDKDGKELFLIYSSIQQRITWNRNKQGEIILEVRDPFKQDEPLFTFDQRALENKN